MPGKMKECNICFTVMRSDNLRRHMRCHQNGGTLPFLSDKNKTSDLRIETPIPTRLDEADNETDSNSDESLSEISEINEPIPARLDKVTSDSSEAALQSLIAHEKMELLKLLEEFVEVVDKEDENKLIELEKLLDDFFISKTKNSGLRGPKWETLPKVHGQLDSLINSKIPRTELIKAKILAENLDKKQHIFQEIQQGIKNGQVDDTLNRLQYQVMGSNMLDKIKKLDEMNFENIAAIINSGLPVNFD